MAIDCGETGHWPQLEEPAFFTHSFENWLREQKMISEKDIVDIRQCPSLFGTKSINKMSFVDLLKV
ncbi:MAG: hypothetical protein WC222_08185 [Parachlamydiales bacterium]